MDNAFSTEQEAFWAGSFGDEYIDRNQGKALLASNMHFFSRTLARADSIQSCLECGANVGMNLRALAALYPEIDLAALEINQRAVSQLRTWLGDGHVIHKSLLEWEPDSQWDLVMIKGVIIHIAPDALKAVYERLWKASKRYILVCEYYNRTPVAVDYRGHKDRLFKRDFAGEMLDIYSDLNLVDYGFFYHRDNRCPQDDITWFLMEKK